MSAHSLHVVARFTAKPEAVSEVARILSGLIGPSRKEPGCLRYELLQNQAGAAEFLFVEEWADDAALDTHLATAHLQEALVQVKPLLSKMVDVRKYSALGVA